MQTVTPPGLRRSILRLAVAAALIAFVTPFLPAYWFGVLPSGFPLRGVIHFFLGYWNDAIVVTVGIVFLKRDHVGVAGGVFAAVALGLAISIAGQILVTAPHFGRWETVVVLMLETSAAILLVLAAARAIGASRDERRPSRAADEDPSEG